MVTKEEWDELGRRLKAWCQQKDDKGRRPDNCADRLSCGWHHVKTEPEVGLYLCSRAGCPNMAQAATTLSNGDRGTP